MTRISILARPVAWLNVTPHQIPNPPQERDTVEAMVLLVHERMVDQNPLMLSSLAKSPFRFERTHELLLVWEPHFPPVNPFDSVLQFVSGCDDQRDVVKQHVEYLVWISRSDPLELLTTLRDNIAEGVSLLLDMRRAIMLGCAVECLAARMHVEARDKFAEFTPDAFDCGDALHFILYAELVIPPRRPLADWRNPDKGL
jgi:hypothetical protein